MYYNFDDLFQVSKQLCMPYHHHCNIYICICIFDLDAFNFSGWGKLVTGFQRVDHTLVRGSIPSVSLNMSEFWIRDSFYIVDWVKSSCIPIPIGFGMPRPNWFLTNVTTIGSLVTISIQYTCIFIPTELVEMLKDKMTFFLHCAFSIGGGGQYLMHEQDTTLTNCTWLLHDAPINPFNYYFNSATGEPYRLQVKKR